MGSLYRPKYKDKTGEYHESSVWWIKYYRDGFPIRESAGTEKESQARNLLKQREGDVARGIPVTPRAGRMKFSELAEDVVNNYKANGRRTLRDLRSRLDKHILPVFGPFRVSAINASQVTKFIADRQEAGAANAEINRELAVIKRAFSLALQSGKMMFAGPHFSKLKENNVRKGFFEREQFDALLSKLVGHGREDLQPVVRFAYVTGWRRSEILSLQWRQVDFEAGRICLDPGTTKNDDGRVFPFTLELREVLEEQKAKTEVLRQKGILCPWVFHRNGQPIREFKRSWATACKNAGVPARIFHDFRRTAVRNLVRAGVPERVAMKMTGHKTRSVFDRYNIVSEGDFADAALKLDEAAGKVTGKVGAKSAMKESASFRK